MRIAFIASNCVPFHNGTLEERPLGGTETGVIRLAQSLEKLGNEIFVVTAHPNPPLSTPLYLPLQAINDLPPVDVLIAVRDWQAVLVPVKARFKAMWTGDAADQPATLGIGDKRFIEAVDSLFLVSYWHAETMSKLAKFPLEKIFVLRNGVHLDYFSARVEKDPTRLIYSSTPYRGLRYIPRIFSEIQKQVPRASMHVFSAFDVYAGAGKTPENERKEFESLKAELNSLPNCQVHGNVLQAQLAQEFMKSSILLYPNTFAETSCITAMEAQAAGCVIVTSALGALPETVAAAGVLIPGQPGTKDYDEKMVELTVKLLTDQKLLYGMANAGLMNSQSLAWEERARELEQYLSVALAS